MLSHFSGPSVEMAGSGQSPFLGNMASALQQPRLHTDGHKEPVLRHLLTASDQNQSPAESMSLGSLAAQSTAPLLQPLSLEGNSVSLASLASLQATNQAQVLGDLTVESLGSLPLSTFGASSTSLLPLSNLQPRGRRLQGDVSQLSSASLSTLSSLESLSLADLVCQSSTVRVRPFSEIPVSNINRHQQFTSNTLGSQTTIASFGPAEALPASTASTAIFEDMGDNLTSAASTLATAIPHNQSSMFARILTSQMPAPGNDFLYQCLSKFSSPFGAAAASTEAFQFNVPSPDDTVLKAQLARDGPKSTPKCRSQLILCALIKFAHFCLHSAQDTRCDEGSWHQRHSGQTRHAAKST